MAHGGGVLGVIQVGERSVEFAVSGAPDGEPVLIFYPLGASRRLALFLDKPARSSGARLICVNRPGMGKTSCSGGSQEHLDCSCSDAAAVLESLGIHRTSVLFFCAGAPFAFAFCSRFRDLLTGRIAGCSSWVSPADCSDAKLLYKLGASFMPAGLLTVAAGFLATCFRSLGEFASADDVLPQLMDEEAFEEEAGGEGEDAAVLLSPMKSLGICYKHLPFPITLFHGDEDETVPLACAEWLCDELPEDSRLHCMSGASHSEVMIFGFDAALRELCPKHGSLQRGKEILESPVCVF